MCFNGTGIWGGETISRVQNQSEHLVSDGDWSRPRDVPTAVF